MVDYLTAEMRKTKDISKIQNQSVQESSHTENQNMKQKKKKENNQLNMNKNTYKITLYRDNG